MGLVANLLDRDWDRGCKGTAEWWPLGVQGKMGRGGLGRRLYVGARGVLPEGAQDIQDAQ